MTSDPPYQFSTLGLDRDRFKRAGKNGWRGPCPRCAGNRHLLIFTDKQFPRWNYECQCCGMKGWADQLNAAVRVELTPEEKRRYAQATAADEAETERARLARLGEYTAAELWTAYAARMTADHRAWWEEQGVPLDWQAYLRIGYEPSRGYCDDDGILHHSRAYSIPYWHTGFKFVTMQYRLFDPPTITDRYRWEKGLGTAYYQAEPQNAIGPQVIICEGAKKAIVTATRTDESFSVLGVPSKSDFGGVVDAVKDAERVYVLLDPDAGYRADKLARAIGPAARVVDLAVKVDDGFTRHGLTNKLLQDALRYARPM